MEPTWAFAVRGEGTATLELDVYDVIGEGFLFRGVTAKDVLQKLKDNAGVESILVRINSGGGDVFDGVAIYSLLAESEANVTVKIDGLAASAASIIAMAGDDIQISAGGFVMIHNPWTIVMGEASDLVDSADRLEKISKSMADIYVARTKQKRSDVIDWMNAETWMGATEAKQRGFADTIMPAKKANKKAQAQAFASLNLDRFENAPESLRVAVMAARSNQTSLPVAPATPLDSEPAAQREQTTPPPSVTADPIPDAGEETMDMSIPKTILSALNLNEAASEEGVVAAISELNARAGSAASALALVAKFEQPTGKTGDEAVGVVLAWQASHEKLPTVETELATLKANAEKTELEQLIEGGRTGAGFEDKKPRLTKAMADKYTEMVNTGALTLGTLRGILATLQPVHHLAAEPPESNPDVSTQPGTLAFGGKSYEQLSNLERHKLKSENEDLFVAMRKDWEKRGRPLADPAASAA